MGKSYVVNGDTTGSLGYMGRIYMQGDVFPVEIVPDDLRESLLSQNPIVEFGAVAKVAPVIESVAVVADEAPAVEEVSAEEEPVIEAAVKENHKSKPHGKFNHKG